MSRTDRGVSGLSMLGRANGSRDNVGRGDLSPEDDFVRFRQFAEVGADILFETGPDLRYTWVHVPRGNIYGNGAEILGKTRWEIAGIDPNDRAEWGAHQALLEAGKSYRGFEFKVNNLDPERCLWWRVSGVPIFTDGAFAGYRGIAEDITAEREAELMRRTIEEQLRNYAEASAEFFFELDAEFRFSAIKVPSGMDADFQHLLLGRRRWEAENAVPADDPDWQRHIADHKAHRPYRDYEYRLERADTRDVIWFRVSGVPYFAEDGAFLGYRGTSVDVTAEKIAHENRAISEARFRDFAEASADVVWETDAEFRVTWAQVPQENELMISDELLGQTLWEMIGADPENDELWRDHIALRQARKPFRGFEYPGVVWKGRQTWWRANGVPNFDKDGTFKGYRGSTTQITETKEIELQLQRSHKLETIGRLTGGIAHDFNNLLAVLQSNMELIEQSSDLAPKTHEMIARCVRATRRGKRMTRQLLTLSHRQDLNPEPVDVKGFLDEFVLFSRRIFPDNIQIGREIGETLPPVLGDESFLHDALLNLCINSRDAMPTGGRISLKASFHRSKAGAQEIAFEVRDSGAGIPSALIEQVFEPFVSTKQDGDGSGLGLSMVRGFAEESGGRVEISSEEGVGTSVLLYLPASSGFAKDASLDRDMAKLGNGELVMLIEDEEEVRLSIASLIETLGYQVTLASSGEEAIKHLIAGQSKQPDLILSDIMMPGGLQGDGLVRRVRADFPGIALALFSGYARDAKGATREIPGDVPVLTKPVSRLALSQVFHDLLGIKNGGEGEVDARSGR